MLRGRRIMKISLDQEKAGKGKKKPKQIMVNKNYKIT